MQAFTIYRDIQLVCRPCYF